MLCRIATRRTAGQLFCLATLFWLCGCAADTARPGNVCGHCDYRFSRNDTPNPCDPCVAGVELPCYGMTPTVWHLWPMECELQNQPTPVELHPEQVPIPDATMPPSPAPPPMEEPAPTQSSRRFLDSLGL